MRGFVETLATEVDVNKRKLVHGVGTNDAWYTISSKVEGKQVCCPYYSVWRAMLGRGASAAYKYRFPTYKDCSVDRSWLLFSTFRKWMEKQDWEGKQLDKDLLVEGNKRYGPTTCAFISRRLNMITISEVRKQSELPRGVSLTKTGKYLAHIKLEGKTKHLGSFVTSDEAEVSYLKAKLVIYKEVMRESQFTRDDVKRAVDVRVSKLSDKISCLLVKIKSKAGDIL